MVTKKKLVFTHQVQECLSIGIVSPLKDYRLCWFVNKCLEIELLKIRDVIVRQPGKKKDNSFARFKYNHPLTHSVFYILQNKDAGGFFLSEMKQADYLLFIKGNYYLEHSNEIMEKLKSVEEIHAVIPIDITSLKSKHNILLYDDETERK
ncbi:MAG: IPExxxVDY family protein [Chitinophagales bacterium]